jgi:NADP-dependent 3-hydroxy acid dehydrogenase YdfG
MREQGAGRRVVVVTGASAGIGRAVAVAFAAQGAAVGLIARGRAGLEGAQRDVEAAGGTALAVPTDVADPAAIERAAALVEERLGPIDVWVNAAMTSVFSPIAEIAPAEYRRVTDVTYHGAVWGTMAALRRMRARDRGTIVQVSSGAAYRSLPLQAAYCGAKFALRGFTDGLRSELVHDGSHVHLTMVNLPALNTPQFDWVRNRMPGRPRPLAPVYDPDVAAQAILHVVAHPRRELFVGGRVTAAVILNTFAPGVLDWYLGRTAVQAQQVEERETPGRADNLWSAPDEDVDWGARGRFGAEAKPRSLQLLASMNRGAVGLAAVAAAATVVRVARRPR